VNSDKKLEADMKFDRFNPNRSSSFEKTITNFRMIGLGSEPDCCEHIGELLKGGAELNR
jgi:hypothetical protein